MDGLKENQGSDVMHERKKMLQEQDDENDKRLLKDEEEMLVFNLISQISWLSQLMQELKTVPEWQLRLFENIL